MTKFTEHLRRRWLAIPKRVWACLLTLCCLSLTLCALIFSVNVVYVSDSDGNRRMLVTAVTDPQRLMEMSGIRAEAEDDVYFTAYNGNLASLNIQRAFPVCQMPGHGFQRGNADTRDIIRKAKPFCRCQTDAQARKTARPQIQRHKVDIRKAQLCLRKGLFTKREQRLRMCQPRAQIRFI